MIISRLRTAALAAAALLFPIAAQADPIVIQSQLNSQYVCLTDGYLSAACSIGQANQFDTIHVGNGYVALVDVASGGFVAVQPDARGLLRVGPPVAGPEQWFEIVGAGNNVELRSAHTGQFMVNGFGPSAILGASANNRGAGTQFSFAGISQQAPLMQVPFAGSWELVELYDFNNQPVRLNGATTAAYPIQIDADGTVSFTFGCNAVSGRFEALTNGSRGGMNVTGQFASTRRACADQISMRLESALTQVMDQSFEYDLSGNQLVLASFQSQRWITLRRR